jgi:hypothetical protein
VPRRNLLIALAACGASPHIEHERPARAQLIWGSPDCIPRAAESDPCIKIDAAAATEIRDAILAEVGKARDVPDTSLVVRLASAPIAQWTSNAYGVTATADGVEMSAFERLDQGITAGFTAVLHRDDMGWHVISLSPYAAQ